MNYIRPIYWDDISNDISDIIMNIGQHRHKALSMSPFFIVLSRLLAKRDASDVSADIWNRSCDINSKDE